jgi:hypothetical protein
MMAFEPSMTFGEVVLNLEITTVEYTSTGVNIRLSFS